MKKLILILLLIIPISSFGQVEDIPWQALLTRIQYATHNDGAELYDIGKDYASGTILIDLQTKMVYAIGNSSYYFVLHIKERSGTMEKEKLAKTGINSNICLCDRAGVEWKMDLRYDRTDSLVRIRFYFQEGGKLKALLFDSKFIPLEKLE